MKGTAHLSIDGKQKESRKILSWKLSSKEVSQYGIFVRVQQKIATTSQRTQQVQSDEVYEAIGNNQIDQDKQGACQQSK